MSDDASRRRMALLGAVAVSMLLLLLAAVRWAGVTPKEVGRSDFTSTYMGAQLLRSDRDHLYDEATQARLHAALIAPDSEGNLPFVDMPPAALLAFPVSGLSLEAAYRVWSLMQAALVVAGVLIAAGAAPWPAGVSAGTRRLATVAAAGGVGVFAVLLLGQWDGVNALGIGIAYACWRRQRWAVGGAALAVSAAAAKPHIALGMAALLLGWRHRGVLLGAALGTVATVGLAVAVAGPTSTADLLRQLTTSTTRWSLTEQVGTAGVGGLLLGDTAAAHVLATALGVLALAVAALAGARLRGRRVSLEAALVTASICSLLASPHTYLQDLATLGPVAVIAFAVTANARARTGERGRYVGPSSLALGLWAGGNLVGYGLLGTNALPLVAAILVAALITLECAVRRGGAAELPQPAVMG